MAHRTDRTDLTGIVPVVDEKLLARCFHPAPADHGDHEERIAALEREVRELRRALHLLHMREAEPLMDEFDRRLRRGREVT